jgi:hemoglobin-like flavoprotein
MTPKQIELVENSWDYVLLNVEEAGDIFYQKLFEMRPDVKPLFKGDIKAQSRKLTAMITFLVHKLSNLEEVKSDVIALGKRHNNYEVKPHDYSAVGASLLWTLEKGLGKDWNDELKTAWAELYSILSSLMINAQNPSVAA